MSSVDSYASSTSNKGKFRDKRGEYTLYKHTYSGPCGCHPETCGCSGVRWSEEVHKDYKDGKRVYMKDSLFRIPEDIRDGYRVLMTELCDKASDPAVQCIQEKLDEIIAKYPNIIDL
jgi:hypothetical protein